MKESNRKTNKIEGVKDGMVEGDLVEKFVIGNTKVYIYDGSYRDKTPEDIQKMIRRIEEIGSRALYRQALREQALESAEEN